MKKITAALDNNYTFLDLGTVNSITITPVYYRRSNKGFIDYEYNPFYNYRLSENKYKLGEGVDTGFYVDYNGNRIKFISNGIEKYVTPYTLNEYLNTVTDKYNEPGEEPKANQLYVEHYANELVDFTTPDLNFDLNHPVDIEVQESYDGSVNLILNDDLNNPRIINSRFTLKENNQFEVVDRQGNNDTNIYDESNLEGETNLYKLINKIPVLRFNGIQNGGQMKVGNYVFYFKYYDSDGNETDFVEESGVVSVFKGWSAQNVKGYLNNNKSDKLVSFTLTNIDSAYDYVSVYYTRSTGNENKTELTEAFKIDNKFVVHNGQCEINITGIEQETQISLNDINITFNVVDSVKTQTQAQSRLFFGNVHKPEIPYDELRDLSLRIYPTIYTDETIGYVSCEDYTDISNVAETNKYEYANPHNIYYRLGYWEDIYSFGIVYIMNDFTLSPVFPILGLETNDVVPGEEFKVYTDDTKEQRQYIKILPDGIFVNVENNTNLTQCNCKGVTKIKYTGSDNLFASTGIRPIGIQFKIYDEENVKSILKKYTKGYFFVRQKRIPTILCQGLTLGLDEYSHLPMIPTSKSSNSYSFMIESFLDDDRYLTNDFDSRLRYSNNGVFKSAVIPEAELNSELYSQLFSSIEYNVITSKIQPTSDTFTSNFVPRNYTLSNYKTDSSQLFGNNVTLTYVADGIQSIASKDTEFSSQAGIAEDVSKFSQLNKEDRNQDNANLLRGMWGSYVGVDGFPQPTKLFNVMVSGYSDINLKSYIQTRAGSNEPYFAISQRHNYDDDFNNVCYRGDCFIGTYSHRMCRNFQDPEAPNNDIIVKESTWRDNYTGYVDGAMDDEKMAEINRGDVNAVMMGHWITFKCMSNINLALRCEDDTNVSEMALIGHARTFSPASWFNVNGEYKVPESTMFNAGYNSTTSDKYNFILPDVPYIKNDFTNRVMYSNIHITDAFKNAYRTFNISDYRDYSKEFGSLIYITEWFGDILIVFEHGIGILPVNERVQTAGSGTGQVYLNSDKVLPERPIMISKTYGSQWKDSCIKSESYLYGVDTVAKKIWRTNGRQLEIISDFKIQTFLNDNIQLTERELTPLIGIRNVKSHFNGFKYDVMFTFYNEIKSYDNLGNIIDTCEWNMCFNEKLNLWTTRYTWIPLLSENINNIYFTYDKNSAKNISGVAESWSEGDGARGIVLNNCYNNTSYYSHFNTDVVNYLSEVMYPGIEIPYCDGKDDNNNYVPTKDEICIGELDLMLDDTTSEDYYKVLFKLVNTDDSKNDNNLFSIQLIQFDNNVWVENADYQTAVNNTSSTVKYKSYLIFHPNNVKYKGLTQQISGINYLLQNYILKLEIRAEVFNTIATTSGLVLDDVIRVRLSSLHPEAYNLAERFSTAQFWKHGVAGLIDNESDNEEDNIGNCRWYGKNEPFEFEFIVNEDPGRHKIFDNLVILSNNVMPSQIQYEIIGDAYWFKKIKKESYYFQQTKEIPEEWKNNKKNITEENPKYLIGFKNKFYYKNGLGHYLTSDGSISENVEFGEYNNGDVNKLILNAELFKDRKLNQYAIRKYQDIKDINEFGNIIGNAVYKEDLVLIEIDPILLNKFTVFNDIEADELVIKENAVGDVTIDKEYGVIDDGEYVYQEIRPKDKYMKLRICYNSTPYIKTDDGERYKEEDNSKPADKPIITSIQVIYTPSYS